MNDIFLNQFKALSFDELCERICQKKTTLIVYHRRPDADAIGSAFALRALLNEMGIFAICACVDEIPDRLRFLCDDVQGSALYDEDLLGGHERVISVDSASPEQLGDIFEKLRRDIDIMIDHHAEGILYADNYIRPTAAATAEIIFDIAKWLFKNGRIANISDKVATCLYAAISSDTGCFKYSNVTPDTHRYAAELVEFGIDTADINHRLFECKTLKQIKAEAEAARWISVCNGGRIAYVTFPYSSKFSLNISDEHLETIIDIPRALSGVEVAFAIRQPDNKDIFRVSMRSNSDFDVSAICAKFGGGGHKKAAGCTIEAGSIEDVGKMLVKSIMELMD